MRTPEEEPELPASLADLIEDSRANWVPGPLRAGDNFHRSVRRRIRRRNVRNVGFITVALGTLVAVMLQEPPEDPADPVVLTAEAPEEPEFLSPVDGAPFQAVIAEGGLPDLSADPILKPWYDHALSEQFTLMELPLAYGPLAALYLGEEL
jgi:hypothetical protein